MKNNKLKILILFAIGFIGTFLAFSFCLGGIPSDPIHRLCMLLMGFSLALCKGI